MTGWRSSSANVVKFRSSLLHLILRLELPCLRVARSTENTVRCLEGAKAEGERKRLPRSFVCYRSPANFCPRSKVKKRALVFELLVLVVGPASKSFESKRKLIKILRFYLENRFFNVQGELFEKYKPTK